MEPIVKTTISVDRLITTRVITPETFNRTENMMMASVSRAVKATGLILPNVMHSLKIPTTEIVEIM
jgi:hypothetical protein